MVAEKIGHNDGDHVLFAHQRLKRFGKAVGLEDKLLDREGPDEKDGDKLRLGDRFTLLDVLVTQFQVLLPAVHIVDAVEALLKYFHQLWEEA